MDEYAPESPDLTAAFPAHEPEPIPLQHQGYRGSISHSLPPYTPIESHQSPQQYFPSPQYHQSPASYFPQQQQQPFQFPPHPPPQHHYQHHPDDAMPRRVVKDESDEDWRPHDGTMMFKAEGSNGAGFGKFLAAQPASASFEGIEVRTKFPVARIKRIMQADDDVGKVAQVTPVVVSKALELFMISLVTKAAAEAKSKSSKRVSLLHLKQAVMKDEQFDFLVNIVNKVQDSSKDADKHDDNDAPADEKKRKASGRRKRRNSDDD